MAKKLNVTPILIREVNQTDFYKLNNDPLYQTLEVKYRFDITNGVTLCVKCHMSREYVYKNNFKYYGKTK